MQLKNNKKPQQQKKPQKPNTLLQISGPSSILVSYQANSN